MTHGLERGERSRVLVNNPTIWALAPLLKIGEYSVISAALAREFRFGFQGI